MQEDGLQDDLFCNGAPYVEVACWSEGEDEGAGDGDVFEVEVEGEGGELWLVLEGGVHECAG